MTSAQVSEHDEVQAELDALNEDFRPFGYHCFASDAGHCYAATARAAKNVRPSCGQTLDADTPAELRAKLNAQVAA